MCLGRTMKVCLNYLWNNFNIDRTLLVHHVVEDMFADEYGVHDAEG